jgi:putative salt-induced outer membrane protein
MYNLHGLFLVAALAAVPPASALEYRGTEWKGAGEIGYVATSGNTDTSNLTVKLGVTNERDHWRHNLALEALNTEDDGDTTAERYLATWQSDYKFSEHEYLFGRIAYEDDKFSGYEYRVTESIGYGRRVLNRENMTLDLEAGPGVRQSKLEDGNTEHEFVARVAGRYLWQISENAKFTEDLYSDVGEDATITKSVTALQSKINGNLAMKLTFTVKHTSDVPDDVDKTDTETGVTLVYGF